MEIKGLDALIAKLDSMGANSEQTLKKGVGIALKRIQADAKQLCTVDTGRLRESITTSISSDGNTVMGVVGTSVEYAPYVEFGTGPKGEASDTSEASEMGVSLNYRQTKWKVKIPNVGWRYTSGQPAKPFLFPAYKKNKENIKKDILGVFRDEIAKRGG